MGSTTRLAAVTVALFALAPTLGGCRLKKRPAPPPPSVSSVDLARPLQPYELGSVCEGKGGNARAAAYAKTPGKASPAAIFLKDGGAKSFDRAQMASSSSKKPDPRGWDRWESTTGEETQLVVCAEVVSTHKIGRHCTYDSTDSKSSSRVVTEFASASVHYEVLEAKTGAKVGDGTMEVQAPEFCDTYTRYAPAILTSDFTPVYETALAPLEPTEIAPPKLASSDAWMACEGKPLIGAPQISHEPGAVNKVYALEKRDDTGRWLRAEHQSFGKTDDRVAIDWSAHELPAIVVCETHTREPKKIRECMYSSGRTLTLHPATWSFRVVEAATGNVLAEKVLPARSAGCPFEWSFDDGSDDDADPSYEAQDKLVMPFAKPAAQKQPKRSARR